MISDKASTKKILSLLRSQLFWAILSVFVAIIIGVLQLQDGDSPPKEPTLETLIKEGKLKEAKALQDLKYKKRSVSKNSVNASHKIDTLRVSYFRGTKNGWTDSLVASPGDLLSFELHYYLAKGKLGKNVILFLENLDGKKFKKGEVKDVAGRITSSNLETASGIVTVTFNENIELTLAGVSWQINPCSSTECEENLPESYRDIISPDGFEIGEIEGTSVKENGEIDYIGRHYSGDVVVSFQVEAVSDSNEEWE